MNTRVTLLLVLLFAVLAGATIYSTKNGGGAASGTPTPGTTTVFKFPASSVVALSVTSGAHTVKAAQDANHQWALTSPTAAYTDGVRVTSVVASIANLTSERDVPLGTNPLSDFGLDKPDITATVTLSDGTSQTLLIGTKDPTGAGFTRRCKGRADSSSCLWFRWTRLRRSLITHRLPRQPRRQRHWSP